MIDLGLTKIALIGVVALVVIGPEKLPRVARMAGSLFGRAQRYINQVKSEVSREIELDELRKMQKDVQDAASGFERSIAQDISEAEASLNSAWHDAEHVIDPYHNPLLDPPTYDQLGKKAKTFRKKKLAATSAIPSWFKRQNGYRTHVLSGAARVARFRPATSRKSSSSFH